jgi:hypothetical protein
MRNFARRSGAPDPGPVAQEKCDGHSHPSRPMHPSRTISPSKPRIDRVYAQVLHSVRPPRSVSASVAALGLAERLQRRFWIRV